MDSGSINGLNLYTYCGYNPVRCFIYSQNLNSRCKSVANNQVTNLNINNSRSVDTITPVFTNKRDYSQDIFGHIISGLEMFAILMSKVAGKSSSFLANTAAQIPTAPPYIGGGVYIAMPNGLKDTLTAHANTLQAYSDATSFASKILKGIGIGLFALDLGASAYGNFTNDNLTNSQKWGYTAVDWGISTALFGAALVLTGPLGFGIIVISWGILEFWLKPNLKNLIK